MAIRKTFSIMCDEVRQENNGKFLVIGMYTPDMSVPQLPFLISPLTFVLWLQIDRPGGMQFSAKLTHLESGNIIAQAMGGFQVVAVRPDVPVLLPVRFMNIQFSRDGAYTFSFQVQGEPEILHDFQVILNVPLMQQVPMPPAGPR